MTTVLHAYHHKHHVAIAVILPVEKMSPDRKDPLTSMFNDYITSKALNAAFSLQLRFFPIHLFHCIFEKLIYLYISNISLIC